GLERVGVFLRAGDVFEEAGAEPSRVGPIGHIPADRPLVHRLAASAIVVRDAVAGGMDAEQRACLADLDGLGAELVVPLAAQGALTGFLVCGRLRSGSYFSAGDLSFLRTFANQAALSL